MTTARIYVLRDMNGRPRYVGQTVSNLGKRFGFHLSSASSENKTTPVINWIRETGENGVSIDLLEECDSSIKYEVEREWMVSLREAGHELLNVSEYGIGSKGWSPSEDERARRGERSKARWSDDEYRERASSSMSAHWSSEEGRKQRSEQNSKRWDDPDFRATMTETLRRVNSKKFSCDDCDFVSTGSHVTRHQTKTGHLGRTERV